MEKTYYPKGIQEGSWILVDAEDQSLGRMATQIASYLMGKHRPTFTPGVDLGDFVVVLNAKRIRINEKRLAEKKYFRHSGYPGGIKSVDFVDMLEKHPERIIRIAVWGMLPHNKFGKKLLKKLKVYAGSEHPHEAQNPQPIA